MMATNVYLKQIYYLRTFEKCKHDIKQTSSIIHKTLHRKRKNSLPRVFPYNGRILKEPVEIANAFDGICQRWQIKSTHIIPIKNFCALQLRIK